MTLSRFTDRARRVLAHADDEAGTLGHDYRGTEHILLALLREPDGVAGTILRDIGVEYEPTAARVRQLVRGG